MGLTQAQVEQLLKPIKPSRVFQSNGHSHVTGWDVTAHLNRLFGFGGWEKELLSLDLVFEQEGTNKQGKPCFTVCYRCTMRLRVYGAGPDGRDVIREDGATGVAPNMPDYKRADAHDQAMKEAITQALKRCCKDWGDQFGLSLYNGGQTKPVVGRTLVMPTEDAPVGDVEADVPVPVSLGNDERQDFDQPAEEEPVPAPKRQTARNAPQPQEELASGDEVATKEHIDTLRSTSDALTSEQRLRVKKWRIDQGITDIRAGALTIADWEKLLNRIKLEAEGKAA